MKVLTLTWEYPPRTIGGLAVHVAGLSHAMARKGVDVNVVTVGENQENSYIEQGVSVHAIPPYFLPPKDFISEIQHLNFSLLEKSIKLINEWGKVDIIHAHDWLVAFAARTLKHIYQLPLISTIHATEYGRNNGLHTDLQRYISSVEWWLTYESWKVLVCSKAMKSEVANIFQTPQDKIAVINNGIDIKNIKTSKESLRTNYASSNEKIVLFVGRLVPEKGVQILIEALPRVLTFEPKTKLLIAGKGPYENSLKDLVRAKGLESRVNFLGFVNDKERDELYRYADCIAFPSLYEPFGIVALEGMVAGSPVVVADAGGLSEIVQHGVNGLKFIPGNAYSLSEQIIRTFSDIPLVARLVKRALEDVTKKYSWDGIANQTLNLYEEIIDESTTTQWVPPWFKNNHIFPAEYYPKFGRYEV
ncbi:MAG: glycosyl transferase family 1 [Clostridiaceae bacterium BRH_c20a]|nr:MAG: glycosyl transferase family 1 [Clostridiaceae bacterium BRH_c20a]